MSEGGAVVSAAVRRAGRMQGAGAGGAAEVPRGLPQGNPGSASPDRLISHEKLETQTYT